MSECKEYAATTAEDGQEIVKDKFYYLEFTARKSIRYLTKRKRFFNNWHYFLMAITALSGSGAFTSLMSGNNNIYIPKILTGIVAIASSIDLAIGFSKKANLYDKLQRRFSDLLSQIVECEKTDRKLRKLEIEQLNIEKDEPPTLIALDIFCRNEEIKAQGKDAYLYKFDWYHRLLMHFWSFEGWNPQRALEVKTLL